MNDSWLNIQSSRVTSSNTAFYSTDVDQNASTSFYRLPSNSAVRSTEDTPDVERSSSETEPYSAAGRSTAVHVKGPKGEGRRNKEYHHLFFLKVHKAASTTVLNIIYRFALHRQLHVMLPKKGNILSERSKEWASAAVDLPNGVNFFDVLCNHLVFNEDIIRNSLHTDVKFVGIVRHPLSQFESAFNFYRDQFPAKYLTSISGPNNITTYLKTPAEYEPGFNNSFTHNRMSFDFGMGKEGLTGNDTEIRKYLDYLNRTFDLVMVSERFDESVILFKRLMRWQLRDVVYLQNNVYTSQAQISHRHPFTEQEKRVHQTFNAADYALYEHFAKLLDKRLEAAGKEFKEEVATFQALRQRVTEYCAANTTTQALRLESTPWSASFEVTPLDCQLMSVAELDFVSLMQRRAHQ
ncbi:galactose-3-O-sulfotransferase 2-like [Babylonia areolata]|uniref:galactose-3-O-sulfotransferase 2-like n=1 Tax=Babylonia areolata TaxID=304850 RepID=UPI003FD62270